MDRLTGTITEPARPAPADGGMPPPDGAGGDVVRGAGAGFQYAASGSIGRVREHRDESTWRACVGAPYACAPGYTDVSVLLERIRPGCERFLGDLGGEFALACFDSRQRVLVLATDRFASIPIYYAVSDGRIAFGTDFDWVSRQFTSAPDLDPQALYDYLFFSVVPSNRSILTGICKVPPASALVFRNGRVQVSRYWRPDFGRRADQLDLGARTFDALSGAVKRLATLPDVGCFLSGGLDSSTVCGLAARHRPEQVRAFTIGFDVPDYDESRYARISARHFGLDLHEKRIRSADVTACIDRVVGAFHEPFGNASAVSTYLCAQFARDAGVGRMLAGDGGDELFGGNERYQKQSVFNLYGSVPGWLRRAALDPLAGLSGMMPGPLRKVSSYVEQARVPLPERLFSYNLLVRNDPGNVFTPEFLKTVDTAAPYDYARAIYQEPADGDALDRMLFLDWTLTLTDNDLPKVRMACDLAGVAVHFPMLDPEVVRLSTLVPSSDKLTLRDLRRFYKRAFAAFLPPEVITKEKHGFGVPVGIWITGDPALRERVYARLDSLGRRGIVQRTFIDDLLHRQQTDHAVYYGALLWSLFMLEEWLLARAA